MRCAVRCTLLENEIESSDHRDEKRKGDVIVKQRTSVTRDKSRREPISPETRLFLHFTSRFRFVPHPEKIVHRPSKSQQLCPPQRQRRRLRNSCSLSIVGCTPSSRSSNGSITSTSPAGSSQTARSRSRCRTTCTCGTTRSRPPTNSRSRCAR